MLRRFLIAVCLLAATGASGLDDRTEVDAHLMRLSRGTVRLGRTATDAPVQVVIGLGWRNRAALDRLIRDIGNPQSAQYQHVLSPREFERRFAPRTEQLGALNRFLRNAGLHLTGISRSRLLVSAVGRAERVEQALTTQLVDVLDAGARRTITDTRPLLPAELSAQVVAVGSGVALRAPQDDARGPVTLPLEPREVARLYGFDELYAAGVTGMGDRTSTIAIATAFGFDMDDVQQFWRQMGIARSADSVELISVAGKTSDAGDADQVETTLDVQWATAMAPSAPVLVYAGTDTMVSTFLKTYDRIVSDNRAAVMATSWGRCESDYAGGVLAQIDAIFSRAAAQGITVVAAAGDRGGFECGGQSTPSVSLPAAHPYVLAVGGTSLQPAGTEVGEVVWAGSGGGVSRQFAAPPWQMTRDAGRALADVSLDADPNTGYLVYSRGQWAVYGGTSVGAPIWAALVALTNQARAAAGRPTLGLAAPLLCEAALASDADVAAPFIDITAGDNGAFPAGPGFDLPSGWGVPRAAALAHALSEWSPPSDARGGTTALVSLMPTSAAIDGSARLRFARRCLSTTVDLQARQLPPGSYTFELDGVPAGSFSPDRRGCAMITLSSVDIRGHVVSIRAAGGSVLFSSAANPTPPAGTPTPGPAVQLHANLINTGTMPNAAGSVDYLNTGARHELTVQASSLPDGRYDVRLGSEVIGPLTVRGGSGVARFDSEGISGQLLGAMPLCQPIILARGGSAYLRSASDALSPGDCGRPRSPS